MGEEIDAGLKNERRRYRTGSATGHAPIFQIAHFSPLAQIQSQFHNAIGMKKSILRDKQRVGVCRICKRSRQLTREHVPPRSAFNDRAYRQYYVDEVSKSELLQWKTREVSARGMSVFSLCEECNNKTGTRYGSAYLDFVTAFCPVAKPENADKIVSARVNMFPARVVKQAVSLMLSTSEPDSFEGYEFYCNPLADSGAREHSARRLKKPDLSKLQNAYDDLREYVRLRDSKGLPSSVKLYAYVVANEGSGLHTGIFSTGRIRRQTHFWAVVVGLWPIQWVLVLDGEPDEELLDVTEWSNLGFRESVNDEVRIPCHWCVGKYPFDFRSPEEFAKTRFSAMMRFEGMQSEPKMTKDELFRAAMSFARRKGKWTREGFLMTEFKYGTYYEAEGHRGWLDGLRRDEVRELIKAQLAGVANP